MFKSFKTELNNIGIDSSTEIYLAISGGVDSMVLSNLLVRAKITHTLLHCNFNLRGNESDQDEAFVSQYAKTNKLNYKVESFNTSVISKDLNLTTQECARKLRYDWFFTFINNPNAILLTAHHLDDSIETFFINLLRGTGLKGLTGINSGDRQIYRPLLKFSKLEILDYALKNNITFREDSSNESDNYLRNKLRHNFIPDLRSIGGSFDTKFSALLTELKETDQFIDGFLLEKKTTLKETNQISITELNSIPQFMWHRLFSDFGLSRIHKNELFKLTQSITGSVFNTQTHVLLKDREHIIIKESRPIEDYSIQISENTQSIEISDGKLVFERIENKSELFFEPSCAYFDLEKIEWPITIRNLKTGDKIIPFGFRSEKLISKILKDKKRNKFQKESQLVIESNHKIIWILDLMISNEFSITDKTSQIIKIEHVQY